ncbi:MAG: hypothetical protein L3K19_03790 [Thermoplasmata archaeon]|nr:hypothetical protein [Thermoplasmata archaeon]
MTTEGPDPSTYRIPSLARRLVVAALIAVALLVFIVIVPFELLTRLSGFGIITPLAATTVVGAGVVITGFAVARHILKPTRAYGPVSIAGSAFGLAYLYFISRNASAMIQSHDATVTLTYGTVFLLLVVVPMLNLAAAVTTTVEDVQHPGERLPFDYPA